MDARSRPLLLFHTSEVPKGPRATYCSYQRLLSTLRQRKINPTHSVTAKLKYSIQRDTTQRLRTSLEHISVNEATITYILKIPKRFE